MKHGKHLKACINVDRTQKFRYSAHAFVATDAMVEQVMQIRAHAIQSERSNRAEQNTKYQVTSVLVQ